MNRFDVLVVGCGQAGGPLAWRLAGEGRRVALFERDRVGGTCVNTGCTPTKTFLASAEAAHRARRAGEVGVDVGEVRVDMGAVAARTRRMVERWREGVQENIDGAEGLRLVRAHARFVDRGVLEADGERWSAETIVLDVGARPVVPDLPGLDGVPWLDHAAALELEASPRRLVVLGGGYVGCELGQAHLRLGAEVVLLERHDHVMAREDADVAAALQEALEAEGMEIRTGVAAEAVGATAGGVGVRLSDGGAVEGSHLLVAVGRRPATDGLGCDAGGVALDDRGAIVVDERYRTTAEGVYAVGDCTGGPAFTHVSWDDHRILFDLLHGDDRRTRDGRVLPYAAFTDPQLARVGLSEEEAAREGVACEVATIPFGSIARAIETDRRAGLVKVLVDPSDGRLLGAAVVGAEAAELVHVFAALMGAGASPGALVDVPAVHPAFAEGLQSALMELDRYALP